MRTKYKKTNKQSIKIKANKEEKDKQIKKKKTSKQRRKTQVN